VRHAAEVRRDVKSRLLRGFQEPPPSSKLSLSPSSFLNQGVPPQSRQLQPAASMVRARVVWVLIDGIGDVGLPCSGKQTPLQVRVPLSRELRKCGPQLTCSPQCVNMRCCDAVAAAGVSGLMDPVQAGLACGSDTAHMSMFGFDPRRYYRGRGAFETMGAGLEMRPGDIAFKVTSTPVPPGPRRNNPCRRQYPVEGVPAMWQPLTGGRWPVWRVQCNFAYLNTDTNEVELRRADRNFEDVGPTLCQMLDGLAIPSFPNHSVAVKYATEHRCGVRVRGDGLSDNITGTDPLKDNLPLRTSSALDSTPEAALTSRLVNALSRRMTDTLQEHAINRRRIEQGKPPANCVLLRGCGARVQMPSFSEHHGLSAFMIAPTCLIRGLGMCLEMDIINVPGATGDYNTDLSAKARYTLSTLRDGQRDYDLGFLHVKVCGCVPCEGGDARPSSQQPQWRREGGGARGGGPRAFSEKCLTLGLGCYGARRQWMTQGTTRVCRENWSSLKSQMR
jgi:2,3-bisphosphoglycerate-independent phosphoglycerate mutase